MEIFGFSMTSNMIKLEKSSELEDTPMSENYKLKTNMREKGCQRSKYYGAVFTIGYL